MNKIESYHTKIIVIGAGVAGLTAAKLLHESGYEVVILEGKDRIGGRTHTIQLGSSALDTGAAWVHYQDGNPLKIIAEANDITVVNDSYHAFYLWDKIAGDFSESDTLELLDIAEEIIEKASDYFLTSTVNPSSAAFLEDYLQYQDWNEHKKRLVSFLYNTLLETNYGADTRNISLSDEKYLHTFNRKEDNDAFLAGGYQQLINLLEQGLTIHLNQIIKRIDYQSDTIHISTTNGQYYTCDKVIVTTSLGVLKSGDLQFAPSLDLAKKTAITKMGYGNLEKVILTFKERFWHEKGLLFFNEHHTEGLAFPILLDYSTITGTPTLVIFYAGSYASFIQEKSETYILQAALKVLEKMYDKTNLEPTHYFVSKWSKDPLFQGSYSYSNDDNVKNYIRELARPIDNKVFFAGEATSLTGQAYVHGALFSGVREAVRLGASIDGIKGLRAYIENHNSTTT